MTDRTKEESRVAARIQELAESASRKLGIGRRGFLAGAGGMAASLLAINDVFGRFFDVDPIEMFEPVAYAQAGAPHDLFVFDDQLHLLRASSRADTRGAWNPALVGLPTDPPDFQLVQFIKDVYLDS